MAAYTLIPVSDSASERLFLDVPHRIYAKDPVWVCPLDMEVRDVFNPEKNDSFRDGEAMRWVLLDERKQPAGRIAAFYQRSKAHAHEQPVGGAGFFECVNDRKGAFMLFDAAKQWLMSKGMKGMDAPVNFGENDRFWGLLVKGFTHPSYGMNYNPPYYRTFFEEYGFGIYFEQIARHLDITVPMPERFVKIAEWISKKPGIEIRNATRKELKKYVMDFREIFNDAWKFHEHFVEMDEHKANKLADSLKHVIIEKFMVFGYVNGEPASFLFALPDLNQIFKPLKGKFGILRQLQFLWRSRNDFAWYRKRGQLDRLRVIIIGVRPRFQKLGLESAMTLYPMEYAREKGFREVELSWVGDFNPMSRRLQDATEAKEGKTHHTYRISFDPAWTWKRSESLKAEVRDAERDGPAAL